MSEIPVHEKEIKDDCLELQKEGHTFHCAMRITCGDGECECGKTSNVTPGFSGKMYGHKCAVCLGDGSHEDWCRNNEASP